MRWKWKPSSPALLRGLAIVLVVAGVAACVAGVWVAQNSLVAQFVLPGATEVVVSSRSLSALRVVYHAPGQPNAWREAVFQQVVRRGWGSRNYTFGFTRQFTVTWYSRTLDLGPVTIVESAVVGGDPRDPNAVIVEVHRELHFRNRLRAEGRRAWLPDHTAPATPGFAT
jgi:hypothetical protein